MPSTDNFEDLFLPMTMTTAVRRFSEAADQRIYSAEFERGEKLSPLGDSVHWDETRFSRDLAPLEGPESPSQSKPKLQHKVRTGVMVDIKHHVDIKARDLRLMRQVGSDSAQPAQKISDELKDLTTMVDQTKEFIAAKALVEGVVTLGSVPNSNLTGTLTYPIATLSALAAWNLVATKIRSSEIPAIRKDYRRKSGFHAKRAIANEAVDGFITQNTEISTFSAETLAGRVLANSWVEGGSIALLAGLQWQFTDSHYALDATPDTIADTFDAANTDKIAILAPLEMSRSVYAVAEGLVDIPVSGPRFGSTGGATGMTQAVRGFYAYAEQVFNPVGIRIYVGWKGLYILKMVNGVLSFNSTP
jgi:hypothetical protein